MLDSTIIPQSEIFVTVHAALIDCGLWEGCNDKGQLRGHQAVQLYYYARALDPAGSGTAVINLETAAKILDISIYSVRRRLQWGLNLGLFRAKLRIGKGEYKVWLSSLNKICIHHNLADLGACTVIEIHEIKNLKFIATEATALQLQNRSRWRESHRKKQQRRKTADPKELVSSDLGNGPILFSKGRVIFLKRSHAAYGGSQKRIAWEEGLHPSTVQRRLSDGYRVKHGLDPIAKAQLAVAPNRLAISDKSSKGTITRLAPGQNIITIPHYGQFRLATNIYDINLSLAPKRMTRLKLKRAIKEEENRLLTGDDWKTDPLYQTLKSSWEASLNNKDSLSSENFAPGLHTTDFK